MSATYTTDPMPKVHITHSDADAALAERLIKGLQAAGRFEVTALTDKKPLKRNWKAHSAQLITQADAVLFVLSAQTTNSKILDWQLERATGMSKRIIPIGTGRLPRTAIPEPLAAVKILHFDKRRPFKSSLEQLLQILNINAGWVHKHTELYVRASTWHEAGRPEQDLLTSAEYVDAKNWTFDRPDNAPKPTELHLDYIQASEQATSGLRAANFRAATFKKPERELEQPRPEVVQTPLSPAPLSEVQLLKAPLSSVAPQPPAGIARPPAAHLDVPKDQPKNNRSGKISQAPVAAEGQNRKTLQMVLGTSLVILTGAAVWQALSETGWPLKQRNHAFVQSQFGSDLSQTLFRTQIDQLEQAMNTIDCVLQDGTGNDTDCTPEPATSATHAQVSGEAD